MGELGVDVLLLSVGPDLPYLTGYEAMPLERLTMLVLPRDGDARLVVPRLEAPRVVPQPDLFEIVPWDETDDPIALVARLVGPPVDPCRDRRSHVGPVRARPPARGAARHVRSGFGRAGADPHGQGRRRDRRAAGRGRRGRRDRGRAALSAVRRPDRARRAPGARRAHARARARAVELRHRGGRRTRRQPAPRAVSRTANCRR